MTLYIYPPPTSVIKHMNSFRESILSGSVPTEEMRGYADAYAELYKTLKRGHYFIPEEHREFAKLDMFRRKKL